MTQINYQTILPPVKVCLGFVTHDVKVTRIGDGWNIRIFTNDVLNQEGRTMNKADIGYVSRELLRWEDKVGNFSDFASSARKRQFKQCDTN